MSNKRSRDYETKEERTQVLDILTDSEVNDEELTQFQQQFQDIPGNPRHRKIHPAKGTASLEVV